MSRCTFSYLLEIKLDPKSQSKQTAPPILLWIVEMRTGALRKDGAAVEVESMLAAAPEAVEIGDRWTIGNWRPMVKFSPELCITEKNP